MNKVYVHIIPDNKKLEITRGNNLLDLLLEIGYDIPSSCGRKGICGKCLIEIEEHNTKKMVNACQFFVNNELIIYLPKKYLHHEKHLFQYKKPYNVKIDSNIEPEINVTEVSLDKPHFNDTRSFTARIYQKVGNKDISLSLLRKLPQRIRDSNFRGYIISSEKKVIDWLSKEEVKGCYGIAIDLGTTSIAIEIIDVISGASLGILSDVNPQVIYGDDVISRIAYAIQSEQHLSDLQKKVVKGINDIIIQLAKNLNIDTCYIYDITIAGNTTMIHLLIGVNPTSLGECPFVPVFDSPLTINSKELHIDTNPEALTYIFPSIGGFVGGDIVSGLTALQLNDFKEPFLFIDLGTNGEIVIGQNGQMWTASTAVGPAFEGGRIQCGMRATTGAIEHITYNEEEGDIQIHTIGDIEPMGICGSGLIDLLSILLNLGVIDYTGRLLPHEQLTDDIPAKIRNRVKCDEDRLIFVIKESSQNNQIFLSDRDVRQLQLSCSAIKCGIKLLAETALIKLENIKKTYIAGTFGYHANPQSLLRVGILPQQINMDNVEFLGNTSLAGARMAITNKNVRKQAHELSKKIKHIDLSTLPNFEEEFALSTYFPIIQK